MRYVIYILLLLLACSCSSHRVELLKPQEDAPVWPPPPEAPRLRYISSIYSRSDVYEARRGLPQLIRFVAGDEDTRLSRPMAVAIYPGGGLLVSDTGAGIVHFYDAERQKYRRLGSELDGGLRSPVGIAVMNDGTILVSDSRRRTIERFERDGDHLGSFAGEGIFQRPGGLTLDRETGKVFAVDVLKHAIVVLSEDGKVLHELCDNGDAPGELNFPTHISLDREGFLIISDSMNFRLQRLSTEGDPISTFGEPGDAQGNFSRPKGVASIDTGVYVAVEGLYDSIIFFDQNGTLLMTVGGTGSAPGQFWLPAGVAFDSTRNLLFVADSYNSRVQVFQYLPDSPAEVLR